MPLHVGLAAALARPLVARPTPTLVTLTPLTVLEADGVAKVPVATLVAARARRVVQALAALARLLCHKQLG